MIIHTTIRSVLTYYPGQQKKSEPLHHRFLHKALLTTFVSALLCGFAAPVYAQIIIYPIEQEPPPPPPPPIVIVVNPNPPCDSRTEVCFDTRTNEEIQLGRVVQNYGDSSTSSQVHAIRKIETKAIESALPAYGYAPDDYDRFLWLKRDRSRSFVLAALLGLAQKSSRSYDEQQAVEWLLGRIQAKRIQAAQTAYDEYKEWEKLKCNYVAPEGLQYTKDSVCSSRMAALLTSPAPPAFEALQSYGLLKAYSSPDSEAFMRRIAKVAVDSQDELEAFAKIAGIAAVYIAGAVVPAAMEFSIVALVTTSVVGNNLAAGAAFVGPIAAIVAGTVLIGVNEGIKIFGYTELPKKLAKALDLAKTTTLSPDLLESTQGIQEAFIAFMETTRLTSELQSTLDAWVAEHEDDPFLYRGASFSEFNARWKLLNGVGYRLTDIETYLDSSGNRKWDGVFQPGSGAYALYRTETVISILAKHNEYNNTARHGLIDIETYMDGNTRRWVGVWGPRTARTKLVVDSSYDAFTTNELSMRKQGYRLIDVETYLVGNTRNFAGLWVEAGGEKRLIRNKTRAQFESYNKQFAHLKLVDVETYWHDNAENWAAVWIEVPVGEQVFLNKTASKFADGWISEGKGTLDYDRYDLNGTVMTNVLQAEGITDL